MSDPLIILGMHRSGTTLLTRLLMSIGVRMGYLREGNDEDFLFLAANNALMRIAKSRWDSPESFIYATREEAFKDQAKRVAARYIALRKLLGMKNSTERWGWKDPRNSITAEIWGEVYPDAKFIHILRHGMDVAVSLKFREQDSLHKRKFFGRSVIPYFDQTSPRCMNLAGGYSLWEQYTKNAHDYCVDNPSRCHELKYEDLLASPEKTFSEFLLFIGMRPDDAVEKLASSIDVSRCFAFREDPDLVAVHEQIKNITLESLLGYSA